MEPTHNPQRVAMWTWLAVAGLGCGLAVTPLVCSLRLSGAGGAMVLNGVGVAGLALIMARVSRTHAQLVGRLLAGTGLLAHWVYDAATWQRYAEEEFGRTRGNSRVAWIVVGGAFAIPAVAILVLTRGSTIAVAGVAGFYTLLLVIARAIAALRRRGQMRRSPEARVAADGAMIGGRLHAWGGRWYEVTDATIVSGESDVLVITYRYIPRPSSSRTVVRVPVPPGARGQAEGIRIRLCAPSSGPPA